MSLSGFELYSLWVPLKCARGINEQLQKKTSGADVLLDMLQVDLTSFL